MICPPWPMNRKFISASITSNAGAIAELTRGVDNVENHRLGRTGRRRHDR
jgi:hypothetical protein